MVLVGPPGSGKGTQASIIKTVYQVPHVSTGDLLRAEVKAGTELGKEAEKYMNAGQLVPDSLVLAVVDKKLEQEDGFILDGFPRSTSQAEHLSATLERLGKPLALVASIEVDDPVLVQRLLARGRKDDTEEVIRQRLEVFHKQTAPVLDFYAKQGLLQPVPGEGTIEKVARPLLAAVEERHSTNC